MSRSTISTFKLFQMFPDEETAGPIYGGDGSPRHNQKCGTWEVAA